MMPEQFRTAFVIVSGDNLLPFMVRSMVVVLSIAILLYADALEWMWRKQAIRSIVTVACILLVAFPATLFVTAYA